MARTFPVTSLVHEGHARSGYLIKCHECGVEERIIASGWTGSLPAEVIAKKLSQKGWDVGKKENSDLCPSCIQIKRTRLTVVETEKRPVEMKISAEQPRQMSREDKRLIFGKIDAVYLDEKRGYENGWSDLRVAEDLGVPLAWVRDIREENFGAEGLSVEAHATLKEITEYLNKLDDLCKEQVRINQEIVDLKKASGRYEKIVQEIERTYVKRQARA